MSVFHVDMTFYLLPFTRCIMWTKKSVTKICIEISMFFLFVMIHQDEAIVNSVCKYPTTINDTVCRDYCISDVTVTRYYIYTYAYIHNMHIRIVTIQYKSISQYHIIVICTLPVLLVNLNTVCCL